MGFSLAMVLGTQLWAQEPCFFEAAWQVGNCPQGFEQSFHTTIDELLTFRPINGNDLNLLTRLRPGPSGYHWRALGQTRP